PATRATTRREPPAVPSGSGPVGGPPALDPAPAPGTPAPNGSAVSDAARAAEAGPWADATPATADTLSAMLSAAVPGTSYVDPLGSIDPIGSEAEVSAATQDSDPSFANGSEATG
ncbi:MAG: hypothetical protein WBF34_17760, partial [Streptosporangiaceae bacterium]